VLASHCAASYYGKTRSVASYVGVIPSLVATAQDGEQNQSADYRNNDRTKTAEAIRKESEHPIDSHADRRWV
jgi:hypothetical protein